MSNTFKVGDEVTVTGTDDATKSCARDTTEGKHYTLTCVGAGHGLRGGGNKDQVAFIDDVGDLTALQCEAVTLAEA